MKKFLNFFLRIGAFIILFFIHVFEWVAGLTIKKISAFLRQWSEWITLPLAFVLWYFRQSIIQTLDPTAATFDSGVLEVIIFAIIAWFIVHGLGWLNMRITFPSGYKTLDDTFNSTNTNPQNSLTQWQKSLLAYLYYALYVLTLVILIRVL